MNSQIVIGIVIMVLGSGIGTYFIQKGRTKLAFESNKNLIDRINSLDKDSRAEIINNSDFNKEEIIMLVNKQTKSSAVEIVNEVQNTFGIINEDLIEKEKQIQALKNSEEIRIQKDRKFEILKRTPPKIEIIGLHIKENGLRLVCETKNMVPLRFKYSIVDKDNRIISNSIQLESAEIHPKKVPFRFNEEYNTIEQIKKSKFIDLNQDVIITVNLRYESIYFAEINDQKLKGIISQSFIANFVQNKFIKLD